MLQQWWVSSRAIVVAVVVVVAHAVALALQRVSADAPWCHV